MTQAEKAVANYKEEDLKRQTYDLVQYLLVQNQKSLIKKADINKSVLKDYSKCFKVLMERATTILSDVYGIKVIEQKEKRGCYLLVNELENTSDYSLLSEEDDTKTALLLPVLGLIYMSGGVITDDGLWKFLRNTLNLKRETSTDSVLGDVRKLIFTDFVRQGYLDVTRVADTDPVVQEVRWSIRAESEVSRVDILAFICQMYKNTPDDWPDQQMANEQEEAQMKE